MKLKKEPVALVLTRQALPTFDRTKYASAAGVARGGYILADAEGGKPQVILMATGSEVYLCIDAYEKLKRKASGRASSASLPGICSTTRIRATATRFFRPTSRPALPSSRLRPGLGAICGAERTGHRHAHFWSVRAAQRFAEKFWIYFRCGHAGSTRTTREVELVHQSVLGRARLSAVPLRTWQNAAFSPWGAPFELKGICETGP